MSGINNLGTIASLSGLLQRIDVDIQNLTRVLNSLFLQGGISQLTGPITAGPGAGAQVSSISGTAFGKAVITGAAAGNLTAPGIATTSKLLSVIQYIGGGTAVTGIADLTSQFTITAVNTINNTGGTNTTGSQLFAQWIQ